MQLGEQLQRARLDAARSASAAGARSTTRATTLIHRALLAGLLSNIGTKSAEGDDYQGARGIRFYLHPGSGLAKKAPKWVLAAELTETTRLYARCAARIEPEWIEARRRRSRRPELLRPALGPRARRSRGQRAGRALRAYAGRAAACFVRRDRSGCRARSVPARSLGRRRRSATKAPFLAHNRALVETIARARAQGAAAGCAGRRRSDLRVLRRARSRRVCTTATFERWRREAEARDPRLLFMTRDALMRHAAAQVTEEQYPERSNGRRRALPLKYRFAPGHPCDGLTLTVPLAAAQPASTTHG